jgi:hypothetical protein
LAKIRAHYGVSDKNVRDLPRAATTTIADKVSARERSRGVFRWDRTQFLHLPKVRKRAKNIAKFAETAQVRQIRFKRGFIGF